MKFKKRGQDVPAIDAQQFFTIMLPLPNGVREGPYGSFYVINANGRPLDVVDGDWIIQETFGDEVRARVCKPNVFEQNYEPVPVGFPQPTESVEMPLTLESIAERVAALEIGAERPVVQAIRFGAIVAENERVRRDADKLLKELNLVKKHVGLDDFTAFIPHPRLSDVIPKSEFELDIPSDPEQRALEAEAENERLRSEAMRIKKENAELTAELLRVNRIIQDFNQQTVSVS